MNTIERTDSWERLFADLRAASKNRNSICAFYGYDGYASCVGCPAYEATNCEAYFALDLIDRINGLMEADHDK